MIIFIQAEPRVYFHACMGMRRPGNGVCVIRGETLLEVGRPIAVGLNPMVQYQPFR